MSPGWKPSPTQSPLHPVYDMAGSIIFHFIFCLTSTREERLNGLHHWAFLPLADVRQKISLITTKNFPTGSTSSMEYHTLIEQEDHFSTLWRKQLQREQQTHGPLFFKISKDTDYMKGIPDFRTRTCLSDSSLWLWHKFMWNSLVIQP